MNKERMGKFLKKLRKDKNLSLEELSDIFDEQAHLTVSINAISSWERGKTIPDIDNLNFLAQFYVVSIDEILHGEKRQKSKYKDDFFVELDGQIIEKRTLGWIMGDFGNWPLLYSRTKELIFKYADGSIMFSEKEELNVLLNNYYVFGDGITKPLFLRKIKEMYKSKKSKEEFWWEVQKIVSFNEQINPIANNMFRSFNGKSFGEVVLLLEDWQKDLFLNSFPYWTHKNNTDTQKYYLRLLIENGAKICKPFISMRVRDEKSKTRLIDEVQKLYESIHKPFEVSVTNEKGEDIYITIPNTPYNRLIIENNIYVKEMDLNGFDVDRFFQLLKDNEHLPEEVNKEFCRMYDVDNLETLSENGDPQVPFIWEIIRKDVFRDESVSERINNLLERIKNGELYSYKTKVINGDDVISKRDYIVSLLKKLSYNDYLKIRDTELTNKLLSEIDILSIYSIKDNYFAEEEIKDE